MVTINIIIEKTSDFYDAYAENYPGIYGAGESVKEVKENINQAIKLLQEDNPDFLKEGYDLIYNYDAQSFFNYYSKIFSMPALEKISGINQKQLHHYAMGIRKPRQKQKDKLVKGLKDLAKELESIKL